MRDRKRRLHAFILLGHFREFLDQAHADVCRGRFPSRIKGRRLGQNFFRGAVQARRCGGRRWFLRRRRVAWLENQPSSCKGEGEDKRLHEGRSEHRRGSLSSADQMITSKWLNIRKLS